LEDIKQNYGTEPADLVVNEYISPEVVMTPAEAFYKPSELLSLEKCRGRIATESVMCYPPGIPILAPGERVTPEILEYIQYAREKGSLLTGTEDPEVRQLYVMLE
ncbi:MAG: arginine decarboxylase, partial [Clostridiaceae bacterium]|nr:arginine decarboxylase [Clostridiaceae bacterium]